MALEIRKTSKWWYGRWMKNGVRSCSKLDVAIVGKPGEAAFELSRQKAQEALEKLTAGVKELKRPEDLVQEIHRVKFGHRIGSIPLPHLFQEWQKISRKRQPKQKYIDWAGGIFGRLEAFVKRDFARVKEMAGVDRKIAEAFMRAEEDRKISPKTYNAELVLLRGAFENLREDAGMLTNPFNRMVSKDQATIHRKPFTAEELRAIVDVVKNDALMRPLIVTGVCTAMRRGDACLLKWEAVDFDSGFVTVKTSKTGETVEIPLMGMLREELNRQPRGKSEYAFPALAEMYRTNPHGINWRLGKVFEKAGFINEDEIERRNKGRKRAGWAPLEIERRGDDHVEREKGHGLRMANIRGFHSFRVTWITIALAAGVPMELVRRVTGHRTADVVLQNYFKPGRDDFRKAIEGAMPALMLGPVVAAPLPMVVCSEAINEGAQPGLGDVLGEALIGLEGLSAPDGKAGKAWKQEQARIIALIRQAKQWIEQSALGGISDQTSGHVLREAQSA
jgi:integrase